MEVNLKNFLPRKLYQLYSNSHNIIACIKYSLMKQYD